MRRLSAIAYLVLWIVIPAAWAKDGFLTGVNVVNPQKVSAAHQDRILEELSTAHAGVIRMPLVAPYSASIDFARRASDRGLSIVLSIITDDPQAIRPGVAARDGLGITWAMNPLSGIDSSRFLANLRQSIKQLEQSGVRIAGFELGNEINWTPFNGDFPLPGSGRVLSLQDLNAGPEGKAITSGFDVYLKLLSGMKEIVESSGLYRGTPLISAGLAAPGSAGPRPGASMDAVTISATLEYLRARGLDPLVDGYGVHAYPGENATGEARAALLSAVFDVCSTGPAGKPCWLTEWGFRGDPNNCADDGARAHLIASTLQDLHRYARNGQLRAAIYYAWDGNADPYGVFRCGHLTPSGKLVIDTYRETK